MQESCLECKCIILFCKTDSKGLIVLPLPSANDIYADGCD